ncbi:DUF397 domain-containing protein [Streptomyces gamaensis]|uniref:DUF397 domain-containing protein n=1 Tax=Streptomyces gamaensis TaxID=1763542 RepID=A0ABW0Z803_9ACTN
MNAEPLVGTEVESGWAKSSYSGTDELQCVEVGTGADTVRIRDSKTPASRHLAFTPAAWTRFVDHTAATTP